MVIMRGSVWQTESVSVCVCFSCLPTLSWPRGHRRKCPAHAASDEYQKLQCTVLSLSPSSNQTHNRLHCLTNLKQEVGCMFYFQTKTATSDVFGTSSDTSNSTLTAASVMTAPISYQETNLLLLLLSISVPPCSVWHCWADCWPILLSSANASWWHDVVMIHR